MQGGREREKWGERERERMEEEMGRGGFVLCVPIFPPSSNLPSIPPPPSLPPISLFQPSFLLSPSLFQPSFFLSFPIPTFLPFYLPLLTFLPSLSLSLPPTIPLKVPSLPPFLPSLPSFPLPLSLHPSFIRLNFYLPLNVISSSLLCSSLFIYLFFIFSPFYSFYYY